MYLRHSTVTKHGKTHMYWRLVRAVRVGRKVRQVTVAQLGELDAKGRIAARHLADSLVGVDRQPGLFDEELPTEPVTVVPSRLRWERGRRFGDVWLAWKLWQALGLDPWLEKRLSRGREDVSWSLMAAVLVIARPCEPSSELHIAEDWFRRTALDDLLGLPEAKVNDDRLYRGLDRLLPHTRLCPSRSGRQAVNQGIEKLSGELDLVATFVGPGANSCLPDPAADQAQAVGERWLLLGVPRRLLRRQQTRLVTPHRRQHHQRIPTQQHRRRPLNRQVGPLSLCLHPQVRAHLLERDLDTPAPDHVVHNLRGEHLL